jgi:hypothetical protein
VLDRGGTPPTFRPHFCSQQHWLLLLFALQCARLDMEAPTVQPSVVVVLDSLLL